jgi:hypothetical protein
MVAVALFALLLVPLVWMFRQAEALRLETLLAEHARNQALLASALAQREAAQAALAAAKPGTADQAKSGSLWAGLSVNHIVFKTGQTKDLRIEFSTKQVARSFAAVPNRLIFVGHYHRWLLAATEGLHRGVWDRPIVLARQDGAWGAPPCPRGGGPHTPPRAASWVWTVFISCSHQARVSLSNRSHFS